MYDHEPSKILVVDDEIANQNLLRTILEYEGYEVHVAGNGSDALALVPELKPDLVLLDVMMPNMTGYEVTSRLKEHAQFRRIPIVIVTALADDASRIQGLDAGAEDFVIKPFNRRELSARIRNLLRLKHYSDRLHADNARLSDYDALTGLPNRSQFHRAVDGACTGCSGSGVRGALLLIDIDNFRSVNEAFGHALGSKVIQEVGRRLTAALSGNALVARLGGDEFGVLAEGGEAVIAECATLSARALESPLELGDLELFVTAGLGLARFPVDGTDYGTLIRNAETAMYRAKSDGRGSSMAFSSTMLSDSQERLIIAGQLRHAIERNELSLAYQPKVDLAAFRIVGCEALLRWNNAKLGFVSPARFIPVAEDTGLIAGIGSWVVEQACRQSLRWQDELGTFLRVAVNISPYQFRRAELEQEIAEILQRTGLESRYLEVEVTESGTMRDLERSVAKLKALRALGVTLSMDDFGTGHSSLAYLQKFPLQYLKIDRSFVAGVAVCRESQTIARTIIALGHGLGLTVVAEGIEDEAQKSFLRDEGCDEAQGYLFARPLPAAEFAAYVRDAQARAAQTSPAP
ncbi:MAG: EAL domain-containing protein [Candidatus Schekmanbacteria bacterium]|nr:EAL domain-containing protein [Candidatus Schekmanbacteria bacterium]